MAKAGIKVNAPATVANLACGYDILGLAIAQAGDEIIARPSPEPGLRITSISGDRKLLSKDIRKNTAGVAASHFMDFLGMSHFGVELEIHKKLPVGTGMGSSASSAVAAVVAVNALLGNPLSEKELLPFAVLGEYAADQAFHADNVAPALLGGIVLIRDLVTLDVLRIHVPEGLYVTVVYPEIRIDTKDARAVVNPTLALNQMIRQNANLGSLILGFMKSDLELIARAMQDHVIEPQRAHLIPHYQKVKDAALESGALGCNISGAGPAVFALSSNLVTAEQAAERMKITWQKQDIVTREFVSPVNKTGAMIC